MASVYRARGRTARDGAFLLVVEAVAGGIVESWRCHRCNWEEEKERKVSDVQLSDNEINGAYHPNSEGNSGEERRVVCPKERKIESKKARWKIARNTAMMQIKETLRIEVGY